MGWFDIGVNLMDKRLSVEPLLMRAQAANVNHLLITGSNIPESQNAALVATKWPKRLFSTAGIHPHHAKDASPNFIDDLRELAALPEVLAIGECGLDFNRNFSAPEQQLEIFESQLILATELQLPVFLHERDAFAQQIALLKKYRSGLCGGVAHCFTGSKEQMHAYLDLGFYIGITGWVCDPKRGDELRDAVHELPLDRLLLETDAPYLWPKTLARADSQASGNNEPCNLPHIAEYLATLLQVEEAELEQHAFHNSCQLLQLSDVGLAHEN
jgi:TatD DNase family protein